MRTQQTSVSVTLPVGQAFERMKHLLFRPFDPGKWFVLGFCAWLAGLGRAGFHSGFNGGSSNNGRSVRESFDHAREYVVNNLYWILPLTIVLTVLGLVFWVLFTWLSSRGRFMFLHCVALDKAEVRAPWRQFACEGNSLTCFRLVLGLIGLVPTIPLVVLIVLAILRMVARGVPSVGGILAVIGLGMLLIGAAVVFGVIGKFTTDFVVPIMFLRRSRCLEGWRALRGLLATNGVQFLLYLLFQIVLGISIGILVFTVVIVTCCIAGCFLAIPYLGTVLLLPVLVFTRAYSLYYLAQFGRDYDVFASAVPPTTPM